MLTSAMHDKAVNTKMVQKYFTWNESAMKKASETKLIE